MKQQRLMRYVLYRKMVFSYLLILSLTIGITSFLIYAVFSNQLKKNINKKNLSMLSQSSAYAEQFQDSLMNTAYSLFLDNNVLTVLYSDKYDNLTTYRAVEQLRNTVEVFPQIIHAGLYNYNTQMYISTRGLVKKDKLEMEFINKLSNGAQQKLIVFPQLINKNLYRLSGNETTTSMISVVSFLFPSPQGDAVICLDVNPEAFLSLFDRAISSETFLDRIVMINRKGELLSDLNYNLPGQVIDKNLMNIVIESEVGSGSFEFKEMGEKKIFSYHFTDNREWIFMTESCYRMIIREFRYLQFLVILIAIVLLITGLLYSFKTSRKLHTPIDMILDTISASVGSTENINEMYLIKDALNQAVTNGKELSDILFHSEIRQLVLQGFIPSPEVETRLKNTLIGPFYCVCALTYEGEDRDVSGYETREIFTVLLGEYKPSIIVLPPRDTILILQNDSPLFSELPVKLSIAQDKIREQFNYSFSAGIGSICELLDDLNDSYINAQGALNQKFREGPALIKNYQDVEKNLPIGQYPEELEKNIFSHIDKQDREAAILIIEEFFNLMRGYSSVYARTYIIQLILNLLSRYQHVLISLDYEEVRFYNRIINTYDLCKKRDLLYDLCSLIIEYFKDSSGPESIAQQAHDYIENNYKNPQLCLNTAADKIGLSASYINRLFRQRYGYSFNEALNSIRIDRSIDLLKTSNISIQQICNDIGITNSTYFYTLFKKQTGLTPSRFRQENTKYGSSS